MIRYEWNRSLLSDTTGGAYHTVLHICAKGKRAQGQFPDIFPDIKYCSFRNLSPGTPNWTILLAYIPVASICRQFSGDHATGNLRSFAKTRDKL